MDIKFNGKPYTKASVHHFFNQERKSIAAQNISDSQGYIRKTLFCTELFVHLLGSISELSDYIDSK
ncbi:MAG: hypothetical protein J6L69_07900 [Lachnospiraceae bacterium]|nr:hypothetical protein [Lachnospiraceae bacterium]